MKIIHIVNLVSLILTICLIGYALYQKFKSSTTPKKSLSPRPTLQKSQPRPVVEICVGILLALCLIVVLTFKLGEVPAGLHVDEAGMAYDAISLSKHGTDRFGYHNPVYFINFGGGQNALYTYLASFIIRIFGFSILAIRLPAVLLALAAAATFYFLVRRAKGPLCALISLALFVVLPFSIMHSRWALESYLFFPLAIFSITALWLAFQEHRLWQFVLAGALFGLTLYTYAISYLILPAFLAIVIIYALTTRRLRFTELLAFALPLGLLALPLILMLAVNQGIIGEITTSLFSIPKMWQYRGGEFSLGHLFPNLILPFIIFSHDSLSYNANPEFGTMFYFSIPLVLLGLCLTVRRAYLWLKLDLRPKRKALSPHLPLDALMTVFFVINFLCALILQGPNINRINALYVPLFYFLAVAIYWLYQRWQWNLVILGVLYVCSFGLFAQWYYFDYPTTKHDSDFFVTLEDFDHALDFAKDHARAKIHIQTGSLFFQPYIYTVLADEIDPQEFQHTKQLQGTQIIQVGPYYFSDRPLDSVNPEDTYLLMNSATTPSHALLDQMSSQKFGEYTVYYPPEL